jgi:hypothetical protein
MSNRRFLRSVLTTEPDLDPPEPVIGIRNRRWREQEYTYEQYRHDEEMYQEEINTWRMYDAADQLENSLLEQEDR